MQCVLCHGAKVDVDYKFFAHGKSKGFMSSNKDCGIRITHFGFCDLPL
jgi:hypothetical protein